MADPLIFFGIPSRGDVKLGTMMATHRMGRAKVYCIRSRPSSLLTLGFNSLWAEALNERNVGLTHFMMLHDDIDPLDHGWVDTLLAEHEEAGADVTHVISPIKDHRGLTSTALMDPSTRVMKRLTVTEVCGLPKTFDGAMAGFPGSVVMPNTGLWIADFTKPWVEEICFTIRDRINRNADGTFTAQCFSEDWHFGLQAHRLGLKVFATTAVKIKHEGGFGYPNFSPWGNWKTDEEYAVFNPAEDDRIDRTLTVRM